MDQDYFLINMWGKVEGWLILPGCRIDRLKVRDMIGRLEEDHINAYNLAAAIKSINGVEVNKHEIDTNIIIIKVNIQNCTAEDIAGLLTESGVLAHAITKEKIRFVTHKYVSSDDIEYSIECIKKVLTNYLK
jgi:threonine aldolase